MENEGKLATLKKCEDRQKEEVDLRMRQAMSTGARRRRSGRPGQRRRRTVSGTLRDTALSSDPAFLR
jgi:hypothetical protein